MSYISESFFKELLKESKWREMQKQGRISEKDLVRLRAAGVTPSQERYLQGIAKGTKAKAKKGKAFVVNFKNLDVLKSMTIPLPFGRKLIVIGNKGQSKATIEYIKRHEADEAVVSGKLRKNRTVSTRVGKDEFSGQHAGYKVLKREKEYTQVGKAVGGSAKRGAETLQDIRRGTGEDIIMQKLVTTHSTGAKVRKLDKTGIRDGAKAVKQRLKENLENTFYRQFRNKGMSSVDATKQAKISAENMLRTHPVLKRLMNILDDKEAHPSKYLGSKQITKKGIDKLFKKYGKKFTALALASTATIMAGKAIKNKMDEKKKRAENK